jgi:tRNA U38,U39,U40 pseudouridine synthase TruA
MTRFRLTVEFDGRPFMGWQRQAHGPSVQQSIEEAVRGSTPALWPPISISIAGSRPSA